METTSRRFELLCVIMLAFGQLCIMTGVDSQSFILESVIHSIHEREPNRISTFAGYYGQAVCYFAYVIACFFSPSFLYMAGAKKTLILSSICFASFPLGFLFTNTYYYYFSAALCGVGFALYYSGNGGYITSHSTRQTIESNASLCWGFGSCCMMVGALIFTAITAFTKSQTANNVVEEAANLTIGAHGIEGRFSDFEIKLLFTAFTGITLVAVITFMLMPSQDVSNCLESSEKSITFRDGMKLMGEALSSIKMFILAPTFFLAGIHTAFWLSIYPTSLSFNIHNSNMIYIPAIYSFGVGIGEVTMGIIISFLSKKIKDFGLRPTMSIGCLLCLIYYSLVFVSTPINATTNPTHDLPLLFQPSRIFIFLIGVIAGMSDCCFCSVRSVICAIAMPKRRAEAFSVSKIYQSIGTCLIFFASPSLNLYFYTICIPILAIVSTILFFQAAKRTKVMERKITMELEAAARRKLTMELEAIAANMSPERKKAFNFESKLEPKV